MKFKYLANMSTALTMRMDSVFAGIIRAIVPDTTS